MKTTRSKAEQSIENDLVWMRLEATKAWQTAGEDYKVVSREILAQERVAREAAHGMRSVPLYVPHNA